MARCILIIGHEYRRAADWAQERDLPPPNSGRDAPIYADRVEKIMGLLPDEVVDLGATPSLVQEAKVRLMRARMRASDG